MSVNQVWSPPPVLSQEQAMDAYRTIVEVLAGPFGERVTAADHPVQQGDHDPAWDAGPVLCRDFEDRGGWAVVWESGWDWAVEIGPQVREQLPDVHVEAWFSWAMGLYVP